MKELEELFAETAREIATLISENTDATSILFRAQAKGRVDGDLEISFHLENAYDSKIDIEGGRLQPVVEEYMRRTGWIKRNQPLCLPNTPQQDKDISR